MLSGLQCSHYAMTMWICDNQPAATRPWPSLTTGIGRRAGTMGGGGGGGAAHGAGDWAGRACERAAERSGGGEAV